MTYRLPKSPGILGSASGNSSTHKNKSLSNTRFSSSDPKERCDRMKLLQEKQACNNYNENFEEVVAIADNFFENK